jgi:DNA-binding transcriptional LysR family regulator
MDKLKQMESFVSVATRGSLTAAAKAEGVAPAIMGRRLDALEERLGVKLLVRTTRRITLTHEGSDFLEDCQRLLVDFANAEASVSAGGVKASGHLRITAPAGFGRRHVAPLVPKFRELHADVTISLNLSDRVVDLAGEGFDCAVRVGDMPDSSLVSVRMADNRRLCVAAPDYLKRHGTPQHPADLARFDCLTLSSDASQTRGWAFRVPRNAQGRQQEGTLADAGVPRNAQGREQEGVLADAGVSRNAQRRQQEGVRADAAAGGDYEVIHLKPGGPLDCSDGQVLHDWCMDGCGIAWRSTWEVEAEIAAGKLVPVLRGFDAPPNGIYAVFPQRKHLPLRVRLWIDFLKHNYSQPEFWAGVRKR